MQLNSDSELLNQYAAHKSEAAFGEIVRRYADFVYSAALRQVGNNEQARDVAQTVFIILARKAASLPENTVLIGWLCHTARLAALEQLRKDQRRMQRERHSMDLVDSTPESGDEWQTLRPMLDEAIASLGVEDRDALLLRFFKNESLAVVGASLGVSEDAAQKRVSRALGKLREFLSGRGITTTATALSVALAANAVHSAPAGFAGSLVSGALSSAATVATTPLAKFLTFANMKTSIPLIALTGGLIVLTALQVNARKQLRDAQALAAQQAETINALRAADDQPANPPADLEQLRADARDVLRLRAEVARMQRDLAASRAQVPKPVTDTSEKVKAPAQVNVRARFISVPANAASMLDGAALSESRMSKLMDSLKKIPGARLITQGDVTTLCGRQAEIDLPLSGYGTSDPNLTVGFLAANPPDSSDIHLDLYINSKAMTDLLPTDERPPGMSELAQVESTHALTNSMSLLDGQTAIIGRPVAQNEKWLAEDPNVGITEQRELLILLTPTLITPDGNRLHPETKETAQVAN